MVIRAAASKMGIAILPRLLAEEELASGELVQLDDQLTPSNGDYYFVYPQSKTGQSQSTDVPHLGNAGKL